jgi:hypothetical protein
VGNLLSHVRFVDLSEASGNILLTFFESPDLFNMQKHESCFFAAGAEAIAMISSADPDAFVQLYKQLNFPHFTPSWNKKRVIRARIYFKYSDGGNDYNIFQTGFAGVGEKNFGFMFKNTGLYGFVALADDFLTVPLKEFTAQDWENTFTLEAILFPGSRIQYKATDEEGTYTANIQTNLPSGPDTIFIPWYWDIRQGGSVGHEMSFSSAYFFQDL